MPETRSQRIDMARAKTSEGTASPIQEHPTEDISSQDKPENDLPIYPCASSSSATTSHNAETASTATARIDPDTGRREIPYKSVEQFFREYYRFRDEGHDGFCVSGYNSNNPLLLDSLLITYRDQL